MPRRASACDIEPGQRELTLALERPLNWRRKGWITADTHVHFISPQTALLEAQAEGVNLVNLLAAQWGDLFTNVGDLTGGATVRDDTMVRVGTENRQHMLGHISLLGGKGQPVYPMSAAGPDESYFGDPLWTSLAEWADECRSRDGVVVMPHFPVPYCEAAADVVLGKVDVVVVDAPIGAENIRAIHQPADQVELIGDGIIPGILDKLIRRRIGGHTVFLLTIAWTDTLAASKQLRNS